MEKQKKDTHIYQSKKGSQKKDTHIYQLRFYRCPFSSFFLLTPLSFRTGIVRNPSGRDSNLSEHSPPCEVDPVQSMYRMTAGSVGKNGNISQKKDTHIYQLRFYRCPFSSFPFSSFPFSSFPFSSFFLLTPLSFRTGIVRNPSGRDSNLSEHSPPCEVDPVQSMYMMTAGSVGKNGNISQKKDTHIYQLRFYRCPFSSFPFSSFFLLTPLSFRTGIVRNPSGRDSNLSEHSTPCEVDPVQSMYRMTAGSVGKNGNISQKKEQKKDTHIYQLRFYRCPFSCFPFFFLLRCHSVQGLYGTHLAGIAICPSIHLPVKWILYNPCT